MTGADLAAQLDGCKAELAAANRQLVALRRRLHAAETVVDCAGLIHAGLPSDNLPWALARWREARDAHEAGRRKRTRARRVS